MAVPVQTEIAERASRRLRTFGVALIATVLVAALPLPWRLSGLAFATLSMWTGVRLLLDLTALRRAGRPASGWLGVSVGLGLAVFMSVLFGFQAAFYPMLAEQERCVSRAVTHLDRDQCRAVFEQRQQEIIDRLEGTR